MMFPWKWKSYLLFFISSCTAIRSSLAWTVSGVSVHKVPLQRNDADSPWCFAASSITDLKQSDNFLATQVWPSARMASAALQQHLNPKWVVCEFGCGPGLPSLTAVKIGASRTIATDLDTFALKLVQEAATLQGLNSIETNQFDLTANETIPKADLYILSDVFESSKVALGAAALTKEALAAGARVWVFAQTDRSQREIYIKELRRIHDPMCKWSSFSDYIGDTEHLWLCEVDETTVSYG